MKTSKIINAVKNSIFPKDIKCIACGEDLFNENKYYLCEKCLNEIEFCDKVCLKCGNVIRDESDYCMSCLRDINKPYEKAFAPLIYKGKVVDMVHMLKYHSAKWIANYLANFMVDEFKKQNIEVDVVVPIPLSEKRYKEREYNQAELLARCFCEKLNLELDTNNLIRLKHTETQTKLNFNERKENILGSFSIVDKNAFKNKNILVIDDVFTTGATMGEACQTISNCKPNKIYCLTLAHVEL